jgi:hypothetical protein
VQSQCESQGKLDIDAANSLIGDVTIRVLRPSAHASDFAGLQSWEAAYMQMFGDLAQGMRVLCGGRRRRDGQPCQAKSVPGKRRCKWHGGCSTGPRTPEGRTKALVNLRRGPSPEARVLAWSQLLDRRVNLKKYT